MNTTEPELPWYHIRPAMWPLVPLLGLMGWVIASDGTTFGIASGIIVGVLTLSSVCNVVATIRWERRQKA